VGPVCRAIGHVDLARFYLSGFGVNQELTPRKVCEMTVEKRHLNGNVLDSDGFLSDELVEDLTNELAPLSQRGKELTGIDKWFGSVEIAGTLVISRKTYENAVVEIYGNNSPDGPIENQAFVIIWKNTGCKDSQPATKPR
jgi:hypothetical protein